MKKKPILKTKKELRVIIDKDLLSEVQIQAIKKDNTMPEQVEKLFEFGLKKDVG